MSPGSRSAKKTAWLVCVPEWGLNVRVAAPEEVAGSSRSQLLDLVEVDRAGVPPLTGITLDAGEGDDRGQRLARGATHVVLRRDQLQLAALALLFARERGVDRGVDRGKIIGEEARWCQGRLRRVAYARGVRHAAILPSADEGTAACLSCVWLKRSADTRKVTQSIQLDASRQRHRTTAAPPRNAAARQAGVWRIYSDTLALTKMNWNNTQFDGHAPITIRAARQVGNILNYVGPDYGHLARDGREHVAAFLDSLGADEAAAAAWTLGTMEDSRRRRATTGVAQKRIAGISLGRADRAARVFT